MVVLLMSLNVDQTQSILPCLPYDGAIVGVFLKQHFEYQSPH
jgi:hypothetical protein